MQNTITESKKRQLKKSIRNGAEIIQTKGGNDIKAFYDLLAELYRTKIKTPLPPLLYFNNFAKLDLGVFLLVKYKEKIIGGLMGAVFNGVIYELYICGEDGKYKDIYPSVLATWSALDYGLKNNLQCFDFLGAGKPSEDYGVREFKSKFGGELVNYGRYKLLLNRPLYKFGEIAINFLKKYR